MPKKIALSADTNWASGNPFESLSTVGLPANKTGAGNVSANKVLRRGRVEVRREKKGRGGKEVTTLTAFQQRPHDPEKFLRELKHLCGAGGARLADGFFVQGDQREKVMEFLRNQGYSPVQAGG